MIEHSLPISTVPQTAPPFFSDSESIGLARPRSTGKTTTGIFDGWRRRFKREVRRRKVGRAYDMALEISQYVPRYSRVLDAGCGSGFIAHHLSALLEADVTGIDLGRTTAAPIDYQQFDGVHFPVRDRSFDAVLLCYVLHHAQKLDVVLAEVSRVLNEDGMALIYEDMPERWWDRLVCALHDLKWRKRTGPCTFRNGEEWHQVFVAAGFEVTFERELSRWRNLAHPVKRRLFVFMKSGSVTSNQFGDSFS